MIGNFAMLRRHRRHGHGTTAWLSLIGGVWNFGLWLRAARQKRRSRRSGGR